MFLLSFSLDRCERIFLCGHPKPIPAVSNGDVFKVQFVWFHYELEGLSWTRDHINSAQSRGNPLSVRAE